MMRSCNGFRLVSSALMFFVYSAAFCLSTAAIGQTTIDLDPPKIEHTVPAKMAPGKPLKVLATVTDDSGIEQVTVFYRTSQTGRYQSTPMMNVQGAEYTALLTTEKKQSSLQYYIESVDLGGNRVLEGSPGTPLVVQAAKKSNLLYVVLGAVAIGLLAGAAGGSSSDSSSTEGSRVLTINANVPE